MLHKAKNMGASEFLIRQVLHKNIWYFSSKMRKGKFLSHSMKDKRKDCIAKLLNKLKHPLQLNMLWFFSDEKNFLQDQMVNSQNSWLTLSSQDVLILMKDKQPVHIIVFGVVTSNDDNPPFTLPHGFRLNKEAYIKCLKVVVLSWIERTFAQRLCLTTSLCTMPHKQENPVLAMRKFL